MSALVDMAAARRMAREHGDFSALRGRIPYADFLGIDATVTDGQPVFRLPFRADLIGNPVLPAIHGGAIAGFMESAAQLHLLLTLDERRLPKSINFSVDYLRPSGPADCMARCEVTRQGSRVAQVQVRCWQLETQRHADAPPRERNVALARAHFLLASDDES